MSSNLVLDMRTCAAALLSDSTKNAWAEMIAADAARLLVEASNLLDALNAEEPIGDLMQPMKSSPALNAIWAEKGAAGRITELPAAVPRPCPACGNVAARKVRITNTKLLLTCPMCLHEWEYAP